VGPDAGLPGEGQAHEIGHGGDEVLLVGGPIAGPAVVLAGEHAAKTALQGDGGEQQSGDAVVQKPAGARPGARISRHVGHGNGAGALEGFRVAAGGDQFGDGVQVLRREQVMEAGGVRAGREPRPGSGDVQGPPDVRRHAGQQAFGFGVDKFLRSGQLHQRLAHPVQALLAEPQVALGRGRRQVIADQLAADPEELHIFGLPAGGRRRGDHT